MTLYVECPPFAAFAALSGTVPLAGEFAAHNLTATLVSNTSAGYTGANARAFGRHVAESQPWSVAEWAGAPRFDHPRATVVVLVLGRQFWGTKESKRL